MERTQNEFGFEIITEGQFVNQGCTIRTAVIRLNDAAMYEYILSDIVGCPEFHGGQKNYREYVSRQTKRREAWENEILQGLDFVKNDENSACISENVSEIFTVILMEQLKGGEADDGNN